MAEILNLPAHITEQALIRMYVDFDRLTHLPLSALASTCRYIALKNLGEHMGYLAEAVREYERGQKVKHTSSVHDITDTDLLRRAVKSALDPNLGKGVAHPRWTAVCRVFSLGSTYARQLCCRFDLNPDEMVKR